MKVLKIGIIVVLATVVLIPVLHVIGYFAAMSAGNAAYEKQIKEATQGIATYTQQDWSNLYSQSMSLISALQPTNVSNVESNQWPALLVPLRPGNVWLNTNNIEVGWTGGFVDFELSMCIAKEGAIFHGQTCHAGVYILDSRASLEQRQVYKK